MRSGQALVEFALVVPVMLFTFLGMAEAGLLFAKADAWQRGADVLAEAAAIRIATEPAESWRLGWESLANDEQAKASCGEPDTTFPDETQEPGDRVTVTWNCIYSPILVRDLWAGLVTTISSTAVIPYVAAP
jgi:Flp pilus assembly protein TadG